MSGATALHLAAGSGNHELCEVMTSLEHTDVSIEDENGAACDYGIILYFKKCLFLVTLGQTAIDMALNSGYKELASKLAYWSVVASRSKVLILFFLIGCKHAFANGSIIFSAQRIFESTKHVLTI